MAEPDHSDKQLAASNGPRPLVIDAHVHAFPDEVIANRDDLVRRDHWFGHLYANPAAVLTNDLDLLVSMATSGVDHAVMCGFPWSDPGLCRFNNDWMAAASASSAGRLSWLGIVVPSHRSAAAEAERCFSLGAVGIGELNADGQGFDLSDQPSLATLISTCVVAGRPALLHATEPVGRAYPGKGTATPDRLLRFLARNQDLDVVLAHWGGGLPFYELMPEVAALCRRVRYDTAASPYLYRHDILQAAATLIGPDRILWGSDFPVLSQGRFLRRTLATDIDPESLRRIVGGSAQLTFGLTIPSFPPGGAAP